MLWDVNFLWQGRRRESGERPIEAATAKLALGKLVGRLFPARQVGLITSSNLRDGTWHAAPAAEFEDYAPARARPLTVRDNFLSYPAMRW